MLAASSNFPLCLPNSHSSGGLPLTVSGSEPYSIDAGKAAGGGDDYARCKITTGTTDLALVQSTEL